MPSPLQRLARLPLRSKLALLAVIPLVGLSILGGLVILANLQARSEALTEQGEINRIGLAADVAQTLVAERDRAFSPVTTVRDLEKARAATDSAIELYRDFGLSDEERAELSAIESELGSLRQLLGGLDEMLAMQDEAVARQTGDVFEEFQRFNVLTDRSTSLVRAESDRLTNPEAVLDAAAVEMLAEFNVSVRTELLAYVAIGRAEGPQAAERARTRAIRTSGSTLRLQSQLLTTGDDATREAFRTVITGENYRLLTNFRTRIAAEAVDVDLAPPPVLIPVFEKLFKDIGASQDTLVINAMTATEAKASESIRTLLAAAGIVVILVAMIAVMAFSLLRSIRGPLVRLTNQSRRIAKTDLPSMVATIRELGGDALIEMPEPITAETDDEIGELVDAFNQLHSTAVQLASEQAASRRTVSEMFVNMGRRNQKILMRLLASLEQLEQKERNPETLQELFKIDHLATRMRRNAESLLVLAGARTSRSFGQAVAVGDVIRASLSEVEGYDRVTLRDDTQALLNGKAVSDVAHLLAELIENALQFSPPSTPVEVVAKRGDDGLIITVGDRGIGLTPTELDANNQRIATAADYSETPSRFLGLYVVGRLAARHQLSVQLINGVPNGLIARINVPENLCDQLSDPDRFSDDFVVGSTAPTPPPTPAGATPPAPRPRPDAAAESPQRSAPQTRPVPPKRASQTPVSAAAPMNPSRSAAQSDGAPLERRRPAPAAAQPGPASIALQHGVPQQPSVAGKADAPQHRAPRNLPAPRIAAVRQML